MKQRKQRYSKEELEKVLVMVENGSSYAAVCEGTSLNKSIIAREMRKRGNVKARKNIDDSNKRAFEEFIKIFER
jgi:hypothetical protein